MFSLVILRIPRPQHASNCLARKVSLCFMNSLNSWVCRSLSQVSRMHSRLKNGLNRMYVFILSLKSFAVLKLLTLRQKILWSNSGQNSLLSLSFNCSYLNRKNSSAFHRNLVYALRINGSNCAVSFSLPNFFMVERIYSSRQHCKELVFLLERANG